MSAGCTHRASTPRFDTAVRKRLPPTIPTCLVCMVLVFGCLPGRTERARAAEAAFANPAAHSAGSGEIDLFNALELSDWHLELTPELRWQVYYEDNIEGSSTDEISDFSNCYTPALEVTVHRGRLSLTGSTEVKIIEYFDERDWNTVDQDHSLAVAFEFTPRTSANLTGAYTVFSDPDRYFEQSAVPGVDGGYIVRRYKNKTKNFLATIEHKLSARSLLTGMFSWSNFETGATDDSDFYMASMQYAYTLAPRTTLTLNGQYTFFDFAFGGAAEGDTDFLEDIVGGADGFELFFNADYEMKNYNLSAGIQHRFSETANVNLSAGWRYTKNDKTTENVDPATGELVTESQTKSGDGFTFSCDFTKKLADATLALKASQNVGTNPDTGATYENRRISLTGTYTITDRWRASASVQYYNQDADTGDEFAYGTDQDSYYGSVGLQYKYSRRVSVSFSYGYSKTKYNNTGRETDRRTALLGVTFTPLRNYVMW